jgi:hypothetical protein
MNIKFPTCHFLFKCAAGLALLLAVAQFSFAGADINTAAGAASNSMVQVESGTPDNRLANPTGLPPEITARVLPQQTSAPAHQRMNGNLEGQLLVSTLVPLGVFAMIVLCVALGASAKLKRAKILHETLRAMIEKGQPIPPELLRPQQAARLPRSDLRTGLVMIAIGFGLSFLLLCLHDVPQGIAAVGAIPFLMGVAFLIVWKIETKNNGAQPK